MKKAALAIGLIVVLSAMAAPLFAQGPFADVPTDHWAYEAVNQLQQDGILIGYPDGTFGGKRAMTRYEFAVAVARMIPIILKQVPASTTQNIDTSQFATKSDIANMATKADLANYCTKADCDAIRKLVDEFRDELAALGVDVDALKRDVAALNDRVTALEKEVRRVRWTGDVNVIGTASDLSRGPQAADRDDRLSSSPDLIKNISELHDVNLNMVGSLTDSSAANIKVVGGNYLSWIGTVDDYSVFSRPDSKTTGLTDKAALYFANLDWALGKGKITVGRQPIQWTPYTLKMIDVDSYTNIGYTDSGDYPVDGARLQYRFGGVKLDAFAGKNNENTLLAHGLTAQPTSGLYNNVISGFAAPVGPAGPFNVLGGHAVGGLTTIDQSAGVRLSIGTPFKGNLSGSWMQAAGPVVTTGLGSFDSANVFGADLNFNISKFLIAANWAQSNTLGVGGTGDIDSDNMAIDAKVGFMLGKFGIDAGWRRVERNFAAPGYWDKLGRWTNPSNVEGPFAALRFGITPAVSLVADGSWYKGVDDFGALPSVINDTDDKILHVQGGLKWGVTNTNSVTLGAEWVRWDPSGAGNDTTDELYWNIGWGYQINPSAGFKVMYQIVDYSAGAGVTPYGGSDYKENIAVAQFGVKF